MTTPTVDVVVPDVLGDLRTALRELTDLNPYIAGGVFFQIPVKAKYPLIRLTDTGWSFQPGETPVGTQRVAIEVFGAPLKGGVASDYYKVSLAKNVIVSWIWALTGPIGATTRVLDGDVDTVNDLPDPDDGGPRKVISAVLTVIHQ
jgi:hypothetical protein